PRSGVIGVPIPGTELKLVPNGDKHEIRVRGPNIMPGYWRNPELSAKAFDDEGFYLIGDAVRLADPADPARGLIFDGRVAEDFKLSSGTWVNVGGLRLRAVESMAPIAQDVVVCGHDRGDIRLLVFVNAVAARQFADLRADTTPEQVIQAPAVRARVAAGLAALRAAGGGSSSYAVAALLMTEPPGIDAGEITDKAYVNQRAVLTRRAALVRRLYEQPAEGADIVTA
ncbi:MAG: AMP-binding protein, partial [Burkholderiaceae bacterium]|nr:AMP-binding protein [Burkholderiaceae bacterium]